MSHQLDVEDANFFNQWRQHYGELASSDHFHLSNLLESKYPHQKHFSEAIFQDFFKSLPRGARVLEIGGWKGELAKAILSKDDKIESWDNHDICSSALQKNVCDDIRYFRTMPDKFDWFNKFRTDQYDVCVSSNTIEHFSDEHLVQLINYIAGIQHVFFEAPIEELSNDWKDYDGTHILKMGWRQINNMMEKRGYFLTRIYQHACRYDYMRG